MLSRTVCKANVYLDFIIYEVIYGGPQVQNTTQTQTYKTQHNTTQTYKTQHKHKHTKHNTDIQNTTQICQTQYKYVKHKTNM